jgi:hypothetical protein
MFAEAFDALSGQGIEESTEPLIHKNSTPLVLLLPLNPLLPHTTTSLRNLSPSISKFFIPSRDLIPVCKTFISSLNYYGFLMFLPAIPSQNPSFCSNLDCRIVELGA